jgi:hypothetical protein
MGHEGASTAFPQVIQGADLTGHFELVVMEETINGSPFGSQTMRSFKKWQKAHRSRIPVRTFAGRKSPDISSLLPAKLPARTDCARDLSKKGAREMDATFQKKSLLSDKNSLISEIISLLI